MARSCFDTLKKQLLRIRNIKHLHGHYVIHPVIPAKAGIQGFADALQAEDWTPAFAGVSAPGSRRELRGASPLSEDAHFR